ncbi:ABC transporter permease [Undibacterium sp.]|uniref:ABC transporter permease n=1 Tax=Undibacterium sp. TaxID=1914977 RepID=UPI003753E3BB
MLKNYLMMALNVYRRRKMFTAINLFCIVLTLIVLLVVTAMVEQSFSPSGVLAKRGDRILTVSTVTKYGEGNVWTTNLGYKLIEQYLKPMKSAELVGAVSAPKLVAIYRDDVVHKSTIRYTDDNYWKILDFQLLAGRWINDEDIRRGSSYVVISGSIATKLFGKLNPVGQKLSISMQQYEIIGVVEDARKAIASAEMWAPLTTMNTSDYRNSLSGDFNAILLARDASQLSMMKKELREISATVQQDDPAKWPKTHMLANTSFDEFARGFSSRNSDQPEESEDSGAGTVMAWIVLLMFLFMLLPALNLVNLNMGRMMERSVEIGVRKAFGASNLELVGQFLFENLLLTLIGCGLAFLLIQLFLLWLGFSGMIPYFDGGINLTVYLYGVLIATVFSVVSGILPAWRMAKLDPVFALKGNA